MDRSIRFEPSPRLLAVDSNSKIIADSSRVRPAKIAPIPFIIIKRWVLLFSSRTRILGPHRLAPSAFDVYGTEVARNSRVTPQVIMTHFRRLLGSSS